MSVKRGIILCSVLPYLFLQSCSDYSDVSTSTPPEKEIRNVILMIGDGMGLPHVYAAMTVSPEPLNIQRTKVTGIQTNYSANNYITDSGASATAIATGTKTNNYSIGVDPQGNRLKSILEIAEENNLATGLVSTSAITHATPAAFIAHQTSRGSLEQIALDFLRTDVDVFIGGGYNHFAVRKDNLNLLDSLRRKGYEVVSSVEAMTKSTASKLAALTAPDHNPYRLKGRGDMLPLATSKAIEILSRNGKGFFLMVEGSQIDFAGHANAADTLIDEVLDFDKAVGVAIDYAERAGNTLVVVTSDHETGGVTIVDGNREQHKTVLNFAKKDHTAVMIPVYVYGPGAYSFTGIYDNTEIFKKIKTALRL